MRTLPVTYVWRDVDLVDTEDGTVTRARAMVPLPRYGNVVSRQFVAGEQYVLDVLTARNMRSHSHYFAALGDAFESLPEALAKRFPTFEHWRKWLLIEEGFFIEKEFDCPDEKFAKRLGLFIRTEDEYARIGFQAVPGSKAVKVIVRRAKSQSVAAMGAEEFERSKKQTLERASAEIGVTRRELEKQAGRNA